MRPISVENRTELSETMVSRHRDQNTRHDYKERQKKNKEKGK
jgi:hypothetical protein